MPKFRITAPDGKSFDVEGPEGSTAEQALAQVQAQYGSEKTEPETRPMPVNAGIANLAATTLGLPMQTVKNVANLGIAGYGLAKGALGGTPPDLIQSMPGDIANTQALFSRTAKDTGIAGLSPENPSPESGVGTAAYDFASRGGIIPGGALPAAGSMIGEKLGGVPGAVIGSLLPGSAKQAYNEARAPRLAAQQSQNQVRDASLRDAQEAGYKMPTSRVNPTFVGNRLEGMAGKSALNQEFQMENQLVTNRLANKAIGVPENVPLTEQVLKARREEFSEPYRKIVDISPTAANTLEKLREARHEATAYYKHYDISADPASQKLAKQFDNKAKLLDGVLESIARRSGQPNLVQEMREARVNLAKTYDVERALNLGDANIDAKVLGRALDSGKPLSGELLTIAKFALGPGRQFVRQTSATPTPGVSGMESYGAAHLGLLGQHTGMGWLPAGLPFISGPIRSGLTSDWYQKRFGTPNYEPATQPKSLQSLIPILEQQP